MARLPKCFKTGKTSFRNRLDADVEIARIQMAVNHTHPHRED